MSLRIPPFKRLPAEGAKRTGLPAGEKLRLLRSADLFRDLDDGQMERVGQMATMSHCVRGQTIYTPGETNEALFLLKRGRVQIYRLGIDGKKLVIGTVGSGTLFGDMALAGQRMFDGYAEAEEDSTLCVMSRHDIESLIVEYPIVGIRLVHLLADRVRYLEQRLEESSLSDVATRVAAALVRAAEGSGPLVHTTHQQIAETVGSHRETVTRVLGDYRDRGWIALHRSSVHILDIAALRTASGLNESADPPHTF